MIYVIKATITESVQIKSKLRGVYLASSFAKLTSPCTSVRAEKAQGEDGNAV